MLQIHSACQLIAATQAPNGANSVEVSMCSLTLGVHSRRPRGRLKSVRADPELLQKLLYYVRQELRFADPSGAGYVDQRYAPRNFFR